MSDVEPIAGPRDLPVVLNATVSFRVNEWIHKLKQFNFSNEASHRIQLVWVQNTDNGDLYTVCDCETGHILAGSPNCHWMNKIIRMALKEAVLDDPGAEILEALFRDPNRAAAPDDDMERLVRWSQQNHLSYFDLEIAKKVEA